MGRRTRKPGPIKEDPASTSRAFRTQIPAYNPWVSVNPVPGGALPTDVGALTSDDIDNGTVGLWYHYDPHETFDISGHGSDWVTQDANGIEFQLNLAKIDDSGTSRFQWTQAIMLSGRIGTVLVNPYSGAPMLWGDMVGCTVQFLVERYEAQPHAEHKEVGLLVGIGMNTVMSVTNDGLTYATGAHYDGSTAGDEDVEAFHMNPGTTPSYSLVSGARKVWAGYHFMRNDADSVLCGWSTGSVLDTDNYQHENLSQAKQQKGADMPDLGGKVYLYLASYAKDASGNGSAVRRSGKFKIWYRLVWDSEQVSPLFVTGGNNLP